MNLFWVSTTVDLPAACQLSVKNLKGMAPNVILILFTQAGVGGEYVSLVKALFTSCPGNFCTTVSLLPHLTVQTCYAVMNITDSAYYMNIVYWIRIHESIDDI